MALKSKNQINILYIKIYLKKPNTPLSKTPYSPKKSLPLHHTNPTQSAYKNVYQIFSLIASMRQGAFEDLDGVGLQFA